MTFKRGVSGNPHGNRHRTRHLLNQEFMQAPARQWSGPPGGSGAYAIRALPDLCFGVVSGRLEAHSL